mgnify:CR=1 FL=1
MVGGRLLIRELSQPPSVSHPVFALYTQGAPSTDKLHRGTVRRAAR